MSKVLFCSVASPQDAEKILSELKDRGFDPKKVSALFAEKGRAKSIVLEQSSKAPEGAAAGGGTGGVIGGILGWLVGVGTLAIPGLGPFVAAGPILSALSGAAMGAAVGGLIGSLAGLGISEVEAKEYEAKLKEGHVLVSVHADTTEEAQTVRKVFEACHAERVTESKELAA